MLDHEQTSQDRCCTVCGAELSPWKSECTYDRPVPTSLVDPLCWDENTDPQDVTRAMERYEAHGH